MKNLVNNPIGVFDSGIGGLTVLKELMELMPTEEFIYLADEAYCPYGIKEATLIKERVLKIGKFFRKQNVKAIVIACNTASQFKDALESRVNIPVIDVIEATCEEVLKVTKTKEVALLATPLTLKANIYQNFFQKHFLKVYSASCPEFVPLIEKGIIDEKICLLINKKLENILSRNIDILIYGCTHFGLIDKYFKKCLENHQNYSKITFMGCEKPTSKRLKKILIENNLFNLANSFSKLTIYTTSKKEFFREVLNFNLGVPYEILEIEL